MRKKQKWVLAALGWYDYRLHRGIEKFAQEHNWHLTTSPSVKIQAWNDMGIAYRSLGNTQQAHECFAAAKKLQGP